MSERRPQTSLMRDPDSRHAAVGYMELFFDLVYVFAITQLSHHLLAELDWMHALETFVLFLAIWWAWIFTAWATNWIDPDHAANRLMLCAVMIGSLMMSSAVPHAFGKTGIFFVAGYLGVQIGRSLYGAWATGEWRRGARKTMTRISVWFAVSAVFWIGGLSTEGAARLAWWGAGLTIDTLGPICYFWVPGMKGFVESDWNISGGHMAERCALFIIIALGEGVVMIGATASGLDPSAANIAAFIVAFLGSFAMWWVYFDVGAKRGAEHIEHHENPGRVGRLAFTYWHIPIVAGIILLAVTDELTLAHPLEPVHGDFLLVVAAGMGLFLLGTMTFKRISSGNPWFPLSHTVGLGLTAALSLWGWLAHPPTLLFYVGSTLTFAVVALWEWGSYHGGWIERIEKHSAVLGRLMRRRADRVIARRERKR